MIVKSPDDKIDAEFAKGRCRVSISLILKNWNHVVACTDSVKADEAYTRPASSGAQIRQDWPCRNPTAETPARHADQALTPMKETAVQANGLPESAPCKALLLHPRLGWLVSGGAASLNI